MLCEQNLSPRHPNNILIEEYCNIFEAIKQLTMDPEYERRLLRQPNGRSPLSNSVSIKLLLVSETVSPSKVYVIRLLHCNQ